MKPSRDFCKQQIARLLGKPFSPSEPPAIAELIDTLYECSQSEAHAKKVIDSFTSEPSDCPDPGEVRQRSWELRIHERKPNIGCSQCNGIGFKSERRTINGVTYEGAKRCGCWKRTEVSA